ncbi:tripartite tricarboxylate transporter permease [Pelagibius sp.]|uniref:tripartite tricarboxylate transporter permease n=1 Tax=Pelagibius sp. TaxID=1931238 RepID=UPI003BAF5C19
MEAVFVAVAHVFAPENLIFLVVGVCGGVVLGAIPGLSATMAIALMIPFTLTLDPVASLLMMTGAYKGGIFGGSISAILMRAPGTSAAAATVEDGQALAKEGKGLKALKVSLTASVAGDTFSDIVLIISAAQLARVALEFGPVEYTALTVFALTVVGSAAGRSLVKGLIAAVAGLSLAMVGLDPTTGIPRLAFGEIHLYGGISLIAMLIGLMTVAELLRQIEARRETSKAHIPPPRNRDDSRITGADARLMVRPVIGGSIIGTIIGVIPGLGPTLGAFLGYDAAWRLAKRPEKFGKGSVEAIAGAESGNNAVSGANLIPLLGLGIPGDIEAAILIGAFLIQGLTPGPLIFQESPDVVYGLYVGLIVANAVLLLAGFMAIGLFVRLAGLRTGLLFPVVFVFAIVGTYAFQQSLFDVGVTFFFGVVGYLMVKVDIPRTTFLIGFILGPLLEDNFRRSLQLSSGDYGIFLSSSLGNAFWIAALVSAGWVLYQRRAVRRQERR